MANNSHQDWNTIIFNSSSDKKKKEAYSEEQKKQSKHIPPSESIKLEAPNNLGKTISQARITKNLTQKALANQLGISIQLINKYESGKEIPDNATIAKIEKHIGIKLPRCKKVKIND